MPDSNSSLQGFLAEVDLLKNFQNHMKIVCSKSKKLQKTEVGHFLDLPEKIRFCPFIKSNYTYFTCCKFLWSTLDSHSCNRSRHLPRYHAVLKTVFIKMTSLSIYQNGEHVEISRRSKFNDDFEAQGRLELH